MKNLNAKMTFGVIFLLDQLNNTNKKAPAQTEAYTYNALIKGNKKCN